ncbi:acyl-CoA dehydrogenase family protein [Sphingobium sp.]|uniref:acyl-CoA dehydrogenase family protein n=1 Tax=Sphingobium sp. TaxID=1912891 RepID=UPI0028BE39D5|nr:acyl-CoA dehydrogenase family protein [Sphingobium sp.]
MDLAPREEQAMAQETVQRFLADRYDAGSMARAPMSLDDWRALGELGLFAFLLPERLGGMGGGAADVMFVAEAFGRSLAITPLAEGVLLAGELIARGGTDAQVARWAGRLAQGEAILGFARGGTIEAGRVSGHPGLIRDGMAAAAFIVALDRGGVALVAAEAPGVLRRPVRLVDGSIAAEISLDGTPAELLDLLPGDFDAAIALAELAIVAELVGAMDSLLDQTVDYVKQRQQFGKAIGSFQVIQHRCARLYVMLEQARSMLLKAALDECVAVTAAKAYVCDAALRLAEDAVQLHGGMGVTDELAVGRGLRRVLLLSSLFGGGRAAREALAA